MPWRWRSAVAVQSPCSCITAIGQSVHGYRLAGVARRPQRDGVDEPGWGLLRQRARREVHGHTQDRTDRPPAVANSAGGSTGHLRLDRRVLQRPAITLGPEIPESGDVRGELDHRQARRLMSICPLNRGKSTFGGRPASLHVGESCFSGRNQLFCRYCADYSST